MCSEGYATWSVCACLFPRSLLLHAEEDVLEFCELPLALTMPPSKVHPQCEAIGQKVCKSCEHVF